MKSISLAYSGVHQIFQLALAAHEIGELEGLLCSLVDGRGKWGRRLGKLVPSGTARPLGCDGIPSCLMTEYPWPMLANRLAGKLLPFRRSEHLRSNAWFDRHAADWLERSDAKVFVGGETCTLHSFEAARRRGMKTVLDCAGIPASFLDEQAQKAASDFRLNTGKARRNGDMEMRKRRELELADVILCCSDLQAGILMKFGAQQSKIRVVPLWVNAPFWAEAGRKTVKAEPPLKVVYAGAVSLKKGILYLLEAARALGNRVQLTLVGNISPEILPLIPPSAEHHDYVPKERLRQFYAVHDVLVMPSLGDSFGFVALEAMAAGLPVIVSENCGVPVPDSSWRVPAHDAAAIQSRLLHYLAHPTAREADGLTAAAFAARFSPQRYRSQIQTIYAELLSAA